MHFLQAAYKKNIHTIRRKYCNEQNA